MDTDPTLRASEEGAGERHAKAGEAVRAVAKIGADVSLGKREGIVCSHPTCRSLAE
jgi:hypothetical protein